uniref:Uncharacterized protein n=1 Tax=Tanacetum cinerariifolium TaxID=118510 RepID=A0A699KVA7_TANCI|nr:hypothetical protein [Tanacetum cinerariifolium]
MESLFLMHFFKVLNSGKDFSANLERNMFRLANFPLRLWTSLIVRGDGSCSTAAVLLGQGFIPYGVTTYPKNTPSTAPNCGKLFSLHPVLPTVSGGILSTDHGTPVMSDGCHANISKLFFRIEHSSLRPFADNIPPIATS